MNALIRYRIICEKGKSYNIRSAYCHAEASAGSIGVSISSGGAGISFSLKGYQNDFFARPITINA